MNEGQCLVDAIVDESLLRNCGTYHIRTVYQHSHGGWVRFFLVWRIIIISMEFRFSIFFWKLLISLKIKQLFDYFTLMLTFYFIDHPSMMATLLSLCPVEHADFEFYVTLQRNVKSRMSNILNLWGTARNVWIDYIRLVWHMYVICIMHVILSFLLYLYPKYVRNKSWRRMKRIFIRLSLRYISMKSRHFTFQQIIYVYCGLWISDFR